MTAWKVWKVLIAAALTLPPAAYAAGVLTRPTNVADPADRVVVAEPTPTPTQAFTPASTPSAEDRRGDDHDDDDEDHDDGDHDQGDHGDRGQDDKGRDKGSD